MDKLIKRIRRKIKIRTNLKGTKLVPRLSVFRSNQSIYAQAIDDSNGATLVSANSIKSTGKLVDQAIEVGKKMAAGLKEKKINQIVFDRNGYKYHGAVEKVAETLRANSIKF